MELRKKVAELEVRERVTKEEEQQLVSLQQELANLREKLHEQEVRNLLPCTRS